MHDALRASASYLKLVRFLRFRRKSAVRAYKNRHAGETIFCVGSGSSLNDENLDLLDDRTVIFTNAAYLALNRCHPGAAYSFIQDTNALISHGEGARLAPFRARFKSFHLLRSLTLAGRGGRLAPHLFHPGDLLIPPKLRLYRAGLVVFPEVSGYGYEFSDGLPHHIGFGPSVIFGAAQLAVYLGARRVVLLGVDMNYGENSGQSYFHTQPTSSVPLDDENACRPAFQGLFADAIRRNVQIVNATCRPREDVLPRSSLAEEAKRSCSR